MKYAESGVIMTIVPLKHLSIFILSLCIILIPALNASSGEVMHTVPDAVLGQPDFYHNDPNYNASAPKEASAWGLNHPNGIGIGLYDNHFNFHIAVADTSNNRVLVWSTKPEGAERDTGRLKNGQQAKYVFGQSDFTGNKPNNPKLDKYSLREPYDVIFDVESFIIADTGNNRIVTRKYFHNSGKFSSEQFIGQDGPDALKKLSLYAIDERAYFRPKSINNTFVSDFYNHRLVNYKPTQNNNRGTGTPGYILGQNNYYSTREWNKGGVSSTSLAFPRGITEDMEGNLIVADFDNHRVLIFINQNPSPPPHGAYHNLEADYVLGQDGDFTTRIENKGGVSAKSLFFPADVAVDSSGNLYVADMGNHRVLKYNKPIKENDAADMVFGQAGDFTTREENKGGLGPESLSYPSGLGCDMNGNLYISDTHNNRVLIFYSNDNPGN
jgi:sugar lactone lactonase YvrE